MPIFRNTVTGLTDTLSSDYVAVFPKGVWEKIQDESPAEKLQREARENKVELVPDEVDTTSSIGDPVAKEK